MSWELPDVQATCRKGRETKDQISNIHCAVEKARGWRQIPAFASLTRRKPFCFPVLSRSVMATSLWARCPWGFSRREYWTGLPCPPQRVFPIQRLTRSPALQVDSLPSEPLGKPLTVWLTTNCGKFLKRCKYQTTLSVSWETCVQAKKQPDMKWWTGSKLGKGYIKAVYCHPSYLTYMQSTSCEMLAEWITSWN